MTWRERLMKVWGPGLLAGLTIGDWLKLLADNRFRVHPSCFPRAGSITWYALMNTPARWFEALRYSSALKDVQVPPPLFVLGHWRSGTTLLHELLSVDDRFAFPNLYQVMYPHTFLTTEKVGSFFLRIFSPEHRPQDNMKLDAAAAWEDEFVLCAWGFRTSYLAWAFPHRADHYDRFLTFRGADPQDARRWREVVTAFLKKLTLKHQRPLVLKSPTHTARIRLLLEMFPDAKFVHIHRDPYAVFQSSLHLYEKIIPLIRLHRSDCIDFQERIFRQYNEMHDALFEERPLLPAGRLHEVRFEDLERDPVREVRKLYESLSLPDFAHVEPDLRRYVETLAGYRKNAHPDLPPDLRERVAREWRRSFEAWGYPV